MSLQDDRLEAHAVKIDGRSEHWRLELVKSYVPRRIIPDIDKNPNLIAVTQTTLGRIVLFLCFALTLQALGQNPFLAILSAICAFAGRYRWPIISILGSVSFYSNILAANKNFLDIIARQESTDNFDIHLSLLCVILFIFSSSSLLILFWPQIIRFKIFRHSTLGLILCFLILVLVGQSPLLWGRPRIIFWLFLVVFPSYLWFISYSLGDIGIGERGRVWRHLGVLHSFWSASTLPLGKGVTYLSKFESKTPSDLAVTQLKGLKLSLWAFVLLVSAFLVDHICHDYLLIPRYDDTFIELLSGHPQPWYTCWLSMFSFFIYDVMAMAGIGGAYVACARMAGFRILRNTYKPFAATTIAEFWNRYFYYFKELLVDQFFYPTFFRCFRMYPRLRIFFATFMAACIGNLFFHFALDIHFVPELGLHAALVGEESHAFYTLLLAVGIAASQMQRRVTRTPKGWLRGGLLPRIRVILFFCILHIFDAPHDREHTIWQHGQYLLHLFGLDAWT